MKHQDPYASDPPTQKPQLLSTRTQEKILVGAIVIFTVAATLATIGVAVLIIVGFLSGV